jgi:hypothetical protein
LGSAEKERSMSGAKPPPAQPEDDDLAYQREVERLNALLDEGAEDLERNGPVSPEELRRVLVELFEEVSGDGGAPP